MKNKKGFLVYELVVAFSLTSIISLSLISTTFILKNKSDRMNIETNMIINKTILLNNIREDIYNNGLIGLTQCQADDGSIEDNCALFIYALSGSKKLIINDVDNIIEYGDYIKQYDETVDLSNTSYINVVKIDGVSDGYSDSFLEIIIPMESLQLNEDYGINFIYHFDSRINTFESFEF